MWQCGSALWKGAKKSDPAVQRFHQHLNAEEYEQICSEAVEGLQTGPNHDEMIKLLRAVHKKLGNVQNSKRTNLSINTNTQGTFTTGTYETKFDKTTATESLTWINDGETLKLYSYNIQSNALVTE